MLHAELFELIYAVILSENGLVVVDSHVIMSGEKLVLNLNYSRVFSDLCIELLVLWGNADGVQ